MSGAPTKLRRSGPVGAIVICIGERGEPAKGRVRPLGVVVDPPDLDDAPGIIQSIEEMCVQALIAQATIEPQAGEANLSTKAFWVGLPTCQSTDAIHDCALTLSNCFQYRT